MSGEPLCAHMHQRTVLDTPMSSIYIPHDSACVCVFGQVNRLEYRFDLANATRELMCVPCMHHKAKPRTHARCSCALPHQLNQLHPCALPCLPACVAPSRTTGVDSAGWMDDCRHPQWALRGRARWWIWPGCHCPAVQALPQAVHPAVQEPRCWPWLEKTASSASWKLPTQHLDPRPGRTRFGTCLEVAGPFRW